MRITQKGQVTIPVDIRERFGLLPYTEVDFVTDGNVVQIVRIAPTNDHSRGRQVVNALRGKGDVQLSTDEIMAMTRGE